MFLHRGSRSLARLAGFFFGGGLSSPSQFLSPYRKIIPTFKKKGLKNIPETINIYAVIKPL